MKQFALAKDLAWRSIGEELFAITPDGRIHTIATPTGMLVWNLLAQKPQTLDQLVEQVVEQYEVDSDTARKDIQQFLEDLEQRGLVA